KNHAINSMQSPPSRRRGLKPEAKNSGLARLMSPPSRRRGLKQEVRDESGPGDMSPPSRGNDDMEILIAILKCPKKNGHFTFNNLLF
ncbi:MAG: hypothetical protein J7K90_06830, partial [Desulfuromusa sp.]|nr:hypothetical protein [Desulfuromusa sp.]